MITVLMKEDIIVLKFDEDETGEILFEGKKEINVLGAMMMIMKTKGGEGFGG